MYHFEQVFEKRTYFEKHNGGGARSYTWTGLGCAVDEPGVCEYVLV